LNDRNRHVQRSQHKPQRIAIRFESQPARPQIDVNTTDKEINIVIRCRGDCHLVYMAPASLEDDLGADGTDTTFNLPGTFTRRM